MGDTWELQAACPVAGAGPLLCFSPPPQTMKPPTLQPPPCDPPSQAQQRVAAAFGPYASAQPVADALAALDLGPLLQQGGTGEVRGCGHPGVAFNASC